MNTLVAPRKPIIPIAALIVAVLACAYLSLAVAAMIAGWSLGEQWLAALKPGTAALALLPLFFILTVILNRPSSLLEGRHAIISAAVDGGCLLVFLFLCASSLSAAYVTQTGHKATEYKSAPLPSPIHPPAPTSRIDRK